MASDPFIEDAYELVLGVPPGVRPPNHYDLIRAQLFEGNLQTLASMADSQIIRLRKSKIDHETMNQLYYELCLARGVLTNAATKAAYDQQLQQGVEPCERVPVDDCGSDEIFVALPMPKRRRGSPFAAVVVNLLIATGALIYFRPFGADEPPKPKQDTVVSPAAGKDRPAERRVAIAPPAVSGTPPVLEPQVPQDDGPVIDITRDSAAVSKYWHKNPSGAPFQYDPDQQAVFADQAEIGSVLYLGAWAEIEFDLRATGPTGVTVNGAKLDLPIADEWQPVRIRFKQESSMLSATVGRSEPVGGTVDGVSSEMFASRCEIRFNGIVGSEIAVRYLRILKMPRMEATPAPVMPHVATPAIPRQQVPDDRARAKAKAIIMEVHQGDFERAETHMQKIGLAKKLLQEGIETIGDPNGKFVLLEMASALAIQNGDVSTLLSSIDAIVASYEVEPFGMKVASLTKITKNIPGILDRKELTETIKGQAQLATTEDEFDAAKQLAALAVTLSRSTKDSALIKRDVAWNKEIHKFAEEFAKAQEALDVLGDNLDDPDANLIVGRFRCFYKQDWEIGLAYLALGSDETLKSLANSEAAEPTNADDQAAIGDDWWSVAEKETEPCSENIKRRAAVWYRKALLGLSGLSKAKAEKRLAEIDHVQEVAIAPSPSGKKDSSTRWKDHNSLRTEKSLNEEWSMGRHEFDENGLRLLNDEPIASRFECCDKTKVVLTFIHAGRELEATWCGKRIRVKSKDKTICVAVFQRHNAKLTYSLIANGDVLDGETIRLSDPEATAPSQFSVKPITMTAVKGGEVRLRSLVISGPVVRPR